LVEISFNVRAMVKFEGEEGNEQREKLAVEMMWVPLAWATIFEEVSEGVELRLMMLLIRLLLVGATR
jgi:hypothetical protein